MGLAPKEWPASKKVETNATVWALSEENKKVVKK
jgi:hypothetical protein